MISTEMKRDRKQYYSLRDRLRDETSEVHKTLDERISEFDLTTLSGLTSFLLSQESAMLRLSLNSENAKSQQAMRVLSKCALCDLKTLGEAPLRLADANVVLHPLAVDYVISGSRLGTAVLKKRWLASCDPKVRTANNYFGAPTYSELWREFCREATVKPASGANADQTVEDAHRVFKIYLNLVDEVRPRMHDCRVIS